MNQNETTLPWENEPAPAARGKAPSKTLTLVPATEGETPNLDLLPRADAPAIWNEFREKLIALKDTAETLTVTDMNDTAGMAKARETRLEIRQVRIAVEHTRKSMKEGYLRAGQMVDADAKSIKEACEAYEDRMASMEEFGDRERERLALELGAARRDALSPYLQPGATITTDLCRISEAEWQATLADAKDLHEIRTQREQRAKEEEARQAEEERKAEEARKAEAARQAEADRVERERLRVENERLQAEQERERKERAAQIEADRKAQAQREEEIRQEREAIAAEQERERAKLAAAAAAERKKADDLRRTQEAELEAARRAAAEADRERAKIEAADRMRVAQETAAKAKAEADAAEAARKAANAPDRERLLAYASALDSLPFPVLVGPNEATGLKIAEKMLAVSAWVRKTAEYI